MVADPLFQNPLNIYSERSEHPNVLASLSSYDIFNLPHIETVEVFLGIVLAGDFGNDEIFAFQVVRVKLAALHHQAGFLEEHIALLSRHRGKSCLGRLIMVPSRT